MALLVRFTIVIRPHCSITYVDVAHCYRQSSMVCLSFCQSVCLSVTIVSPANTAELIDMAFEFGLGWA